MKPKLKDDAPSATRPASLGLVEPHLWRKNWAGPAGRLARFYPGHNSKCGESARKPPNATSIENSLTQKIRSLWCWLLST